MAKRKSKKCPRHEVGMIYYFGWLRPACFPWWGQAPVTEFDRAMREFLSREQAA